LPALPLALIGDFNPSVPAHQAIPLALQHAAADVDHSVTSAWVATDSIDPDHPERQLADFAGLWCVPASPYASPAGALAAIRFARETGRPFLGTCGGFQHALLEFARNVLGRPEADHAEDHPDAAVPLIAPLACSLVEAEGTVYLIEGTRLRRIYGAAEAREQYRCRFGLNPAYEGWLAGTPLRISARDEAGEVRAVELDGHPFFVATLYQPERSALRGEGHLLVSAFVAAVAASPRGPGEPAA
jgi:CTP synthase (UTP-ammonia lyase)